MTPLGRCQIPSDFEVALVGISFTFTEPVLLFNTLPCVFIVLECEQVRLALLNLFLYQCFRFEQNYTVFICVSYI